MEGFAVSEGTGYRGSAGPDRARAAEVMSDSDTMRQIDPCGMLDEEAIIAHVGTPRYFGADHEPDACVVRFDSTTTTNGVGSVSVLLSITPDRAGQEIKIADRTAHVLDSGTRCHITVYFNDIRSFFYSIDGSPDGDLCGQLRRIVTDSEPLFSTRPLRAESTRMPQTLGWQRDPCAALNTAYDPDQRFAISALSPFVCDYKLGFDHVPTDINRYKIAYMHKPVSVATHVQSHMRRLRIVGVDATEETSANDYCMIEIRVGADRPFPVVDHNGDTEPWIELLRVTGHSCTETRRIAVLAVKDYLREE